MRIRRQDITRLQEASDSLLVFQAITPDKFHTLHIPIDLDEYEEITTTLFAWHPRHRGSSETVRVTSVAE